MSIDIVNLEGAVQQTIATQSQFGSVDFSAHGTLLATTRLDEIAVDVWNTETGELQQEVTGFETAAPVYSAMLGSDQELLWQSRATVQITHLSSGEMTPEMTHELFVSSAAFSPDGTLLATSWAAFATLWDPDTGERLQNLDQTVPAFEPAFLPETNLLLVGSDDGVRLWDPQTYQELAVLDTAARQMAVSPDGSRLATIDQGGFITIWQAPGS